MKPRLVIRTVLILGVLAAAALIAWLATRDSREPQRIAGPGGVVVDEARHFDGELAIAPIAPNERRSASERSDTAPIAGPDAARAPHGSVVLMHDGRDVPYTGSGWLCFTESDGRALPRCIHAPIIAGAFELPRLTAGVTWKLEHAVLGSDEHAGIVPRADELVLDGDADSSATARVHAVHTVAVEVSSERGRETLARVRFEGLDVDSHARELASTFTGAHHRVDVPPGVRHIRVSADGWRSRTVPVPSVATASTLRSRLEREGRLTAHFVGIDATRAHVLVVHTSLRAKRIDVPPGEASIVVDDLPDEATFAVLFESETGDVVDARGVEFERGEAVITFTLRKAESLQGARLVLRVAHDVQEMPRGFLRLEVRSRFDAKTGGLLRDDTPRVFGPHWNDGLGIHEAVVDCAPGVLSLSSTDWNVNSGTFALSPGEERLITITPTVFAELKVRGIDLASGAGVPLAALQMRDVATDTIHHVTLTSMDPGGVVVRTSPRPTEYRAVGRGEHGRSEWSAPIAAADGDVLELVFGPQSPERHVTFTGPAFDGVLRPNYWSEVELVDADGQRPLELLAVRSSGGEMVFDWIAPANRYLVVAPIHPELGPLASGWIEFSEEGAATFELVPLLGE